VSTNFPKKPVLIRRGRAERFVHHGRLKSYRALPGARWVKPIATHFCDREFFAVDDDGFCRVCRMGGKCRPVKVSVLDITNAKTPYLPDIRRPLSPDEVSVRSEIRQAIRWLPGELGRELRKFATAHWDKFAPDEIEELRRITRSAPAVTRSSLDSGVADRLVRWLAKIRKRHQ
jgi:hypothetical protein